MTWCIGEGSGMVARRNGWERGWEGWGDRGGVGQGDEGSRHKGCDIGGLLDS